MDSDELHIQYLDWMYRLVGGEKDEKTYRKLFSKLNNTEFTYIIPMDENRAEDGICLRYRFWHENGYQDNELDIFITERPCSILEMMVALSIRCEEHIMEDQEIGDRTGEWFWEMIFNLGLIDMYDKRYDEYYVDDILKIFINRKYASDGTGGLFTVRDAPCDMRKVEIWYQLCWYLRENFY